MTVPESASGIVLAGGASRRFGSDKLAAAYEGRPLLERAVAAVAAVSAEVLVVVAPGDTRQLPGDDVVPVPVRRVEDPEAHGGPLVGLLAGLETAREPIAVVVGGDMPALSVDVLRTLTRALGAEDRGHDAAVLVRSGIFRPLPAALRNGAATQAARRILADGERSLVALMRELRTRHVAEAEWRGLDPAGATLLDVDTPGDLPG
ncbi:MAG TPA: NTP transferase domain-containing protein [Candidatus Limnocylindrales bacterium]|nr:NTP transferase domain-containing protein [Candidatus Limnocylindrales bacterium]